MKILNLTQHVATPEQIAAGVVEPANKKEVQALLTFDSLPTRLEVRQRAVALAALCDGFEAAMIGGAPYLMGPLETALGIMKVRPLHAFSVRESKETTLPDGSVRKENVFRHVGFVEP